MEKRIVFLILIIGVFFLVAGCGNGGGEKFVPTSEQGDGNNTTATDYYDSANWLSEPEGTDIYNVDVFYVYPTAYEKTNSDDPNICDINNVGMRSGAQSAFLRQATAFETFANIYAPYYRQADATYALTLPLPEHNALIAGIPTMDVTAAFDYFIKNLNKGRPFILAGHSQGSNVLIYLLQGYLKENPRVYSKMIAAYIIGYPVTQEYLNNNSHVKFAENADDTGVIVSYNTQAPDVLPGINPVLEGQIGIVINPITWTRTEVQASVSEGLGSFMPDPTTMIFNQVPQYADARVDISNGVLICTSADEDAMHQLSQGMPKGVYHSFDYPFYYYNLRQNAENRVQKYFKR